MTMMHERGSCLTHGVEVKESGFVWDAFLFSLSFLSGWHED